MPFFLHCIPVAASALQGRVFLITPVKVPALWTDLPKTVDNKTTEHLAQQNHLKQLVPHDSNTMATVTRSGTWVWLRHPGHRGSGAPGTHCYSQTCAFGSRSTQPQALWGAPSPPSLQAELSFLTNRIRLHFLLFLSLFSSTRLKNTQKSPQAALRCYNRTLTFKAGWGRHKSSSCLKQIFFWLKRNHQK